jgi:YidC/Oxa1 family membrane protein insertase
MDRKSIIVLVACFLLMVSWPTLLKKAFPPKPVPPGTTNAVPELATTTNPPATSGQPIVAETPVPPSRPLVTTNVDEQLVSVTNRDARYVFSSHGGGLKEIELLQYPETISTRQQTQPILHSVATLNLGARVPSMALLGGDALQGDGIYTLTTTASGVHAEKALPNGLVISKDFSPTSNYLVSVTVRIENRASQPLEIPAQQWVVGTATPLGPRDNGQAVGLMWFNGANSQDVIGSSYFSSNGFACTQRIPPVEYRSHQTNITWAAVHNQYFVLAAIPQQPAQDLIARKVELPRPTGDEAQLVAANAAPPQGYETALIYNSTNLAPKQVVERQVVLYAGPKEYQTLARLNEQFNQIDLIMGYGGFFGFFAKALLLGMNWLHDAIRLPYGWAIIAITVIIKLVFWPLTQASTRSMKRMQALQPQMNAIKEKYKDDPVKMNRKTMEFMKEHKVSPLGGCLPMIIQIPVFFGFYRMIQSAIELRGASFLWVADLSKSDTLFIVPGLGAVPFFGIPGVGLPFNLLPLIMGATMLWQARLAPPSPGMDATQAKIMRYMPLMFMLFLYNFSAGLTLYWTVQNLLTITQTKLTRTAPEPSGPAQGSALTPPQKKRK